MHAPEPAKRIKNPHGLEPWAGAPAVENAERHLIVPAHPLAHELLIHGVSCHSCKSETGDWGTEHGSSAADRSDHGQGKRSTITGTIQPATIQPQSPVVNLWAVRQATLSQSPHQ